MKKYLNLSLIFAIAGLCCGVFFREFTKLNGYTARTMLGMAHVHLIGLGMGGFLLVAVFCKLFEVEESKKTGIATAVYTAGVALTGVMMLVRGIFEVGGIALSSGVSGMISGFAGIAHIAVAAGMVRFLLIFKKAAQ